MKNVVRRRAVMQAVAQAVVPVAVLALGLALTGCGGGSEADDVEPVEVVTGVLLDRPEGSPVADVELELLVWPSPLSGASAAPEGGPELLAVDTDTTGADGGFELEALASELSPHAAADGLVGLEIRRVGAEGAGMRTTVRLAKTQDTGVTTLEPLAGLEVTVREIGGGE